MNKNLSTITLKISLKYFQWHWKKEETTNCIKKSVNVKKSFQIENNIPQQFTGMQVIYNAAREQNGNEKTFNKFSCTKKLKIEFQVRKSQQHRTFFIANSFNEFWAGNEANFNNEKNNSFREDFCIQNFPLQPTSLYSHIKVHLCRKMRDK